MSETAVTPESPRHVSTGMTLGKGSALLLLSLVVVLPLVTLWGNAFSNGWTGFWGSVTAPESLHALSLTLSCAAVGSLVNAVAGLATAWVLVRDRFWGQSFLNSLIDLPFALPTVVAGVTLYTVYGPLSPLHVNITGRWIGITLAIMFVTLPFTVRAVQPVLQAHPFSAEAAAATLGGSRRRIFLTVTLPVLLPSLMTGTALSFARAVGEYGSVVFISNNLPYRTEVASSYIYSLTNSNQLSSASAVSVALLAIALVVLGTAAGVSRLLTRGAR